MVSHGDLISAELAAKITILATAITLRDYMSKTDHKGNNFEKKSMFRVALQTLNVTAAKFERMFHHDLIFDKTLDIKTYFYLTDHDDHGRTHKCDFSVFNQKLSF